MSRYSRLAERLPFTDTPLTLPVYLSAGGGTAPVASTGVLLAHANVRVVDPGMDPTPANRDLAAVLAAINGGTSNVRVLDTVGKSAIRYAMIYNEQDSATLTTPPTIVVYGFYPFVSVPKPMAGTADPEAMPVGGGVWVELATETISLGSFTRLVTGSGTAIRITAWRLPIFTSGATRVIAAVSSAANGADGIEARLIAVLSA